MRKSRNSNRFSDEFQKEKNWEWRKKETEEHFTPTTLRGYDDFQVTGAIMPTWLYHLSTLKYRINV